jgi:hypothetical protein
MKHLVSLPESTAPRFHALADLPPDDWFSTSDPPASKLGSGGGTAWLLSEHWRTSAPQTQFGDY